MKDDGTLVSLVAKAIIDAFWNTQIGRMSTGLLYTESRLTIYPPTEHDYKFAEEQIRTLLQTVTTSAPPTGGVH